MIAATVNEMLFFKTKVRNHLELSLTVSLPGFQPAGQTTKKKHRNSTLIQVAAQQVRCPFTLLHNFTI